MNMKVRIGIAEKQLERLKTIYKDENGGGKANKNDIKKAEEVLAALKRGATAMEKSLPKRPLEGDRDPSLASKNIIKVAIYQEMIAYMRANNMTQSDLCAAIGLDQARMSKLRNGSLSMFTIDRLLDMLDEIGIVVNVKFGDGGDSK